MDGSAQPLTILNYAELATFLCVEADRPDRGPISLRAGQHGAVKDSVAEVGLAKICMAEISTMQIRPLKRGPAEVNPGQACIAERDAAQIYSRQRDDRLVPRRRKAAQDSHGRLDIGGANSHPGRVLVGCRGGMLRSARSAHRPRGVDAGRSDEGLAYRSAVRLPGLNCIH